MLKTKPYTPKERAHRAGTIAWFGVLASFLFFLLVIIVESSEFLDFFIIGSMVSAGIASVFGIYGIFLKNSLRIWGATICAGLILLAYGILLYLMRDFCVVC